MIPVSLSGGVEPGARTGTSVGGEAVVVWRGADGQVRVWADRCPHRGMRLSFGFVRQNQLACAYHGWSFESVPRTAGSGPGSAACVAIPAHPGMTPPAKARVPAFGVTESLGMIWIGVGPGDRSVPSAGDPAPLYPVRSVTVAAPAAELRAALAAEPPPGTEIAADGQLITFKGSDLLVLAALQDRGEGSASAHIVTTDPDPSVRTALCRWAALVRDHLAAVVLP
jgi:nitrite reductase/ring-hydroxylating ferredoxin subunit